MIDGQLFGSMLRSAANNLANHRNTLNELNVFPVPDGDTGTNMYLTISSASADIADDPSVGVVAERAAGALLKGSRGNSGVILSMLFAGIAKGLKGKTTMDGAQFVEALEQGVKTAYKAVMRPKEGTILTVARVTAEQGLEYCKTVQDEKTVLPQLCVYAREILAKTPDMLPVLKQQNVVDAGGMGFCFILEGMREALNGNEIAAENADQGETNAAANFSDMDGEDIKFAYCTEFIINRTDDKDSTKFRLFLETIGDSVVMADDGTIIKTHVHTNNPGKVLEQAITYGSLINIKIDNMKAQHQQLSEKENKDTAAADVIAEPEKPYGIVAVSAGEGFSQLLAEFSVDQVVTGGQTMNPSTDDILRAVNAVPAETVFVFPNNKNIILAAEMTKELTSKNVVVLKTSTVPQCIAALMMFDPSAAVETNEMAMMDAAMNVTTLSVTPAIKDALIGEHRIREGDILGLTESKITVVEKDLHKCAQKLASTAIGKETQFVTIYHGQDVTEAEAEALKDQLCAKFSHAEYTVVDGGQPVYHYIIAVE